ncbi:hypothetical protein BDY24DRAFT_407766 [Mrakia frigida]|uniref:Uba4p n=1 Tax=Mrakia frigida TaxID=29902 RepID=UPI003FCC02A6
MILPGMGLPGQLKLKNASVLVVGAGGLGCPVIQYLAAAGVGHIGIVDHDTVELSNLHRQILHTEARIGWFKVDSAKAAVQATNSSIRITTHPLALTPSIALSLFAPYSLIVDCTDTPLTRYLISDACVLLNKTLVSGAALGFNGQVAVYNFGSDGPCYRCVWPKVAKGKARAGTCAEEGVIGGVTGVVGTLMGLEAVKIVTGLLDPLTHPPTLLIYSALNSPPFRSIKLRKRRPTCRSCGDPSTSTILDLDTEDYVTFCGGPNVDWDAEGMVEGTGGLRRAGVKVRSILPVSLSTPPPLIIDVRSPEEFSIVSLPNSINIPLRTFLTSPTSHLPPSDSNEPSPRSVYFVCRRGNDSQEAARALAAEEEMKGRGLEIVDVKGGVVAWGRDVKGGEEGGWPVY